MAFAGLVLGVSSFANAGLITTGYNSGASADGILFDIQLNDTGLNFQSMTFLTSNLEGISTGVELYIRTGSYVGFNDDAAGWNLLFSDTVVPFQTIAPTLSTFSSGLVNIDFTDFVLSSNSTFGFYLVTTDNTNVRYQDGSILGGINASNTDLTILSGESQNFSGDIFSPTSLNSPRDFRGSFTYAQVQVPSTDVPEPSTLAIFALGLMGLASRRFMKKS